MKFPHIFHNWSKWEEVQRTYYSYVDPETGHQLDPINDRARYVKIHYSRVCSVCGEVQFKRVHTGIVEEY